MNRSLYFSSNTDVFPAGRLGPNSTYVALGPCAALRWPRISMCRCVVTTSRLTPSDALLILHRVT